MPSETVLNSALYDGCGKVYFQFFSESRILFFSPSKRNIMTSTCPPLPLPHILREVGIFTENMFKAPLPVDCTWPSQSALLMPLQQGAPLSRVCHVSGSPRGLWALEVWDYPSHLTNELMSKTCISSAYRIWTPLVTKPGFSLMDSAPFWEQHEATGNDCLFLILSCFSIINMVAFR